MQSIRFTLPISASETKLVLVRLRLRLVDILVKMWLLKAFFLVILPVPVIEKRFLALELVFIFGITVFVYIYLINSSEKTQAIGLISNPQSLISISSPLLKLLLKTSAFLQALVIALPCPHLLKPVQSEAIISLPALYIQWPGP